MREYTPMTELLKDIPNYENLYAATRDGRVWSYRRNRFMKISNGNNGYKQLSMTDKFGNRKSVYLHQLIASTYIKLTPYNPDGTMMKTEPEINHINRDKSDNSVDNLEWCDHFYNLDQADFMRKVYCVELDTEFESAREAARFLNLSSSNILATCRGKQKTSGGYQWRYV